MKNSIIVLVLNIFLTLNINAQSWQFANSFGGESGSDPTNNNMPRNLVTDNNGNSYVFGTYGAGTEFNDSTLTHFIDGSRGSFVVKFDCSGQVSWSKAISNSEQSNDQACYMILKDEYLYLSGSCRIDNFYKTWFLDTLVIGSILVQDYPQNSIFPWIPYRNYSYLIKMDLQGNIVDYNLFSLYNDNIAKTNQIWYLWNNQTNQRAFAIDSEDNYYLLARLTNEQTSVLFHNEIPITDTISPIYENGYYQYYLLKLDQNFNFLWFKPIVYEINDPDNFSTTMDFLDMVCDSQNNLYMVGYLQTNNTLGTEPYPVEVDLGNGQHLETYMNDNAVGYLIKMNRDGDVLWTQQTKGYSEDGLLSNCFFESLLLDEETNNIYVSGWAVPVRTNGPNTGTVFGGVDTLVAYYPNAVSISSFLANYDMEGNYKWMKAPYARYSRISSLDLHDDLIYGTVRWNAEFTHAEQYFSYPIGTGGLNICTWDRDGNQVSTIAVESSCSGSDKLYPYDTRVNNWGEIFTTGTYDYGLTFGDHYIHGGGFKMFIAKYGNLCPFISEQTANFCYGTEYNGTVLTQSGDYQFVLESSTPEVDSVINLHATVYPQLTTGINDTTLCANETHILEANTGYNSYSWSAGSITNTQELNYSAVGIENVYVTLTDDNCTTVDTIVITVEICGLTAQNPLNSISLYPVPANAHISVQLANNEKITAYSVFNLRGQLIKSESVNSIDNFGFSVADFTPGQYIIYVKSENGIYSGGFVKE